SRLGLGIGQPDLAGERRSGTDQIPAPQFSQKAGTIDDMPLLDLSEILVDQPLAALLQGVADLSTESAIAHRDRTLAQQLPVKPGCAQDLRLTGYGAASQCLDHYRNLSGAAGLDLLGLPQIIAGDRPAPVALPLDLCPSSAQILQAT